MTVEDQAVRPYDHPADGLADGELHAFRARQLALRSQELSAALDLLEAIQRGGSLPTNRWRLARPAAGSPDPVPAALRQRLALDHTVAMGHSFGAATAFYASARDTRIHAAIGMDPWMFPLPRPFHRRAAHPLLVVNSETFHWAANLDALKGLLADNARLGGTASLMVTLRGTGHMDQSDMVAALPAYAMARLRPRSSTADPAQVLRANNDILLAFLKDSVGVPALRSTPTGGLPGDPAATAAFEARHNCTVDYV